MKHFTDALFEEDYDESSKLPNTLYHATYKQFIKAIKEKGLGNTKQKMWSGSVEGVVYLANDPYVAESYAESAEWVEEQDDYEDYVDNIVILEIAVDKLDKSKLQIDHNVRISADEENTTWEYHGVIPWEAISIY